MVAIADLIATITVHLWHQIDGHDVFVAEKQLDMDIETKWYLFFNYYT